jgi:multicomponent K+:H+ antiporter subunit A
MMMVILTRVMMPVVMLVGFYIFLRGHNEPGGGFIAGLIVSIGFVTQYMASGYVWTTARLRYPYHTIIGVGVLIAGLTGIGSWFVSKPFLTSDFTYVQIPPFKEFELATAALFDLGVLLAQRQVRPEADYPMDIDPSRLDSDSQLTPGEA